MFHLSSRRTQITVVVLILLITSACATSPTAVSLQPSLTNTFTPAPSETPTVTPSMTPVPTITPLPSATPTPDWITFKPATFAECCVVDSPFAKTKAQEVMKRFLEDSNHELTVLVKKAKNNKYYDKPGFYFSPKIGPASAFGDQDAGYAENAIVVGNYSLVLKRQNFGTAKDVDIIVDMGVYLPVDNLNDPISAIRNITYEIKSPQSTTIRKIGVFFPLQPTTINGTLAWGPLLGGENAKEKPGDIVRLRSSVAMTEVGMYHREKVQGSDSRFSPGFAAEGKSLEEVFGLVDSNSIISDFNDSKLSLEQKIEKMKNLLSNLKYRLLNDIRVISN